MPRQSKHRAAIIGAAATLFRRQGYNATGLNEIISLSGAPKGSLYHYFPNGKEQIGAAAVEHAGAVAGDTLARMAGKNDTAAALVEAYGRQLASWMEKSDYKEGCPVATVLLEMAADSDAIALAGRAALGAWRAVFAEALRHDGLQPERADRIAGLVVSAFEGAMLGARVARSGVAIAEVTQELTALIKAPAKQS